MDCCFGGILPDLSDVSHGPKETHVSKDLGNAVLFDFSDHAIGLQIHTCRAAVVQPLGPCRS